MNVNGNAIAGTILAKIERDAAAFGRAPILAIITCAPNFETQKYLELKCRKASAAGVRTNIVELAADVATDDVVHCIEVMTKAADGIILQLPFPPQVDIDESLSFIPPAWDVDALNPKTREVLPPVVGAIAAILSHHGVSAAHKRVTIIGHGRLVGAPAERWFTDAGAKVTVVTKEAGDVAEAAASADIIVCGAGVPRILMPDMIKEGVVILDAGTSESDGQLKGDADPACAEKASLFTPVPGGIGPVTIAILFSNLLTLARR